MDKDAEEAKVRTEWAEDRTIMANERTFSSWIGTGMGSIGVAIALKAVFGAFEPLWAAKLVASVFLLIAIGLFMAARQNACKTHDRLSGNDVEVTPNKNFSRIAFALTFGALCVGAILWSL